MRKRTLLPSVLAMLLVCVCLASSAFAYKITVVNNMSSKEGAIVVKACAGKECKFVNDGNRIAPGQSATLTMNSGYDWKGDTSTSTCWQRLISHLVQEWAGCSAVASLDEQILLCKDITVSIERNACSQKTVIRY